MQYKNILFIAFALMVLMLMNEKAFALGAFHATEAELAQLPPYCKGREKKGGDPESSRKWTPVFGKHYARMHHYCKALQSINNANRAFGTERRGASLRTAEDNLDYMLQNPDPSFVLLPEIMTKKGKVVSWRGRNSEAATWYLKAIEIKPDYIPAYLALIDYWIDLDDKDAALEVLNKGLAIKPDSRSLLRRKKRLQ